MAISYRKKQNLMKGTKNYNKWYGKVVILGKVSTEDLCEEIAHSTTVTEADARAMFAELKVVLRQHLLNSQSVSIDGLGTFKPAIKTSMTDEAKDFDATKIKGYRVNYVPEKVFVPSSELTEKGHRKGTFYYKMLEGAKAQELPDASSASKTSDDSTSSTGGGNG